MRLVIVCLVGLTLAALAVGALGDLIINQPPIEMIIQGANFIDTRAIEATPNTAFCTDAGLDIQGGSGTNTRRSFFRLANSTFTTLPDNAQIIEALLYLHPSSTPSITTSSGIDQIGLFRITSEWNCSTLTWNNQPTVLGFPSLKFQVSNESAIFVSSSYNIFDITPPVKNWNSGAWANQGIMIRWATDDGLDPLRQYIWTSSEATDNLLPKAVIRYQLPRATIKPSYICNGGPCSLDLFSGEGFPTGRIFKVEFKDGPSASFKRITDPDTIPTNLSTDGTDTRQIRVKDFFDQIITTSAAFTVDIDPQPIDITILYRALTIYNSRDTLTGISIDNGGTPFVFDLAPRWAWMKGIKDATSLTIQFTLKDDNQATIGTISISRTMSASRSYIVNGTTITEAILDIDGVTTSVNILKVLASPSAIGVLTNPPFIPRESDVAPLSADTDLIDPFLTYTYDSMRNSTAVPTDASPVIFHRPYDSTKGFSVVSDLIYRSHSGTLTRVWYNDTKSTLSTADDTIIYDMTSSTVRSILNFNGQNISVEAVGTGMAWYQQRMTTVRVTEAFTWTLKESLREYSTTIIIKNPTPTNWTDINAAITSVPGITIDRDTLVVTDSDNGAVLEEGRHYQATGNSILIGFQWLNNSATRTFLIKYTQFIQASDVAEPRCTASVPIGTTYGSLPYQSVSASCQNVASEEYDGRVVVQLPDPVRSTSIIIEKCTGSCVEIYRWPAGIGYLEGAQTFYILEQHFEVLETITYKFYYHEQSGPVDPSFLASVAAPFILLGLFAGAMIALALLAAHRATGRVFRDPKSFGTVRTVFIAFSILTAIGSFLWSFGLRG